MIYVIIGTKAQLIKMAPLLKYFQVNSIPYRYISTGQHHETMDDIIVNFGINQPDTILYNGKDITSVRQMVLWGVRILFKVILRSQSIFPGERKGSIVLVHGDTFSTLLGALMAKFAGIKLGHIESGLRSFNWFHPFPEELMRVLTFKFTDVFFCPGKVALQNIAKERGVKINTVSNTLYESLQSALPAVMNISRIEIPRQSYAVVTLHRYENIYSADDLLKVVEIVEHIAHNHYLLFILHKPTELNLRKFKMYDRLFNNPNIEMRPRYDYFSFIKLLHKARFVVSDGGSNQEECYYLGKPIILLRNATERNEGLGQNCVISNYDPRIVDDFLLHLDEMVHPLQRLDESPCRIIAEHCKEYFS